MVPLMPPPMVRLFSAVHSGAAILAEAVQREPSLVEPGRALEFISRSGLVNLLMRSAIRPTLLKDFLPLLKKWQPAAGAFICGTRRACQPIPGQNVLANQLNWGSVAVTAAGFAKQSDGYRW